MSLEVDIPSSISKFPWWCGLSHFKNVLNITFSDGNKKHDLAKENFYACLSILTSYLELDSLIGLDVYMEKTIDMIKSELLRFDRALKCLVWRDCGLSGTFQKPTFGNTLPKISEARILHVNKHKLAAKLLRMHINHHLNWSQLHAGGLDCESDPAEADCDDPRMFKGHIYLGSECQLTTVQDIETNCSQMDSAFVGFCKKLLHFCNQCLTSYGYQVQKWIIIPPKFKIREYKYLKVNYKSLVDWKVTTNYLQCNPMYVPQGTLIPDICSIDLAHVQPFTARMGATHQINHELQLSHIKAIPHSASIFVPIQSII
ncbi:hypothetical protein BKA83DRAFT_4123864 [Pisolithus microcarpus]|nr:hypothetical protein BKA83DRAFT_4123864 [Pisolithus microcarpus]